VKTVQDLGALQDDATGTGPDLLHAQIVEARRALTQSQKPYFDLSLADSTGTVKIKIWNNTDAFAFLQETRAGSFVELDGIFSRNQYGVNVEAPSLRLLTQDEQEALLAGSETRRARLAGDWDLIRTTVTEMTEPRLRIVGNLALDKFEAKWKRAAAARSFHHARRGGLLEHTSQMLRSARALAPLYPEVFPDLLFCGVIFHDIGKLWENDYQGDSFVSVPSRLGELMGHISIGIEVLNKLWHEAAEQNPGTFAVTEPPSDLIREHLIHLIASHHGQREFGAPVTPRTPEAHLLHYIDNLDAKMEMQRMAYLAAQEPVPGLFEARRPLEGLMAAPLRWSYPDQAEP
jgi:3'-5' exoribonuclease